jgi:hypothetical protein
MALDLLLSRDELTEHPSGTEGGVVEVYCASVGLGDSTTKGELPNEGDSMIGHSMFSWGDTGVEAAARSVNSVSKTD